MRARNLKPSIFKNELLAVADPLYTVIFEGLWCLADREGRLEDRPAKIHFDINPGRAFETTERSLAWLHENEFIVRYEVGKIRYIQVITFEKHQNPHQKEPPSKIPGYRAEAVHAPDKPGASPVQASGENRSGPADSLFSDSGLRTPESPSPFPDCVFPEASGSTRAFANGGAGAEPRPPNGGHASTDLGREKGRDPPAELTDAEHHQRFERVKAAYPRFSGRQDWINAETQCRNHVGNADATWESLLAAADRYAKHIRGKGDEGTQFVKTPGRFFAGADADAFWRQQWPIPAPANGKSRPGAPTTHAEMKAALDAAVDPDDTSEDWM